MSMHLHTTKLLRTCTHTLVCLYTCICTHSLYMYMHAQCANTSTLCNMKNMHTTLCLTHGAYIHVHVCVLYLHVHVHCTRHKMFVFMYMYMYIQLSVHVCIYTVEDIKSSHFKLRYDYVTIGLRS